MTYSILARAENARPSVNGAPYMVIENALPADFYAALAADFPISLAAGIASTSGETVLRCPAAKAMADPQLSPLWRDFLAYHTSQDFFQDIVRAWGNGIREHYPELALNFGKPLEAFKAGPRVPGGETIAENCERDIVLDCQICVNPPVQAPSTPRGPHLDRQFKLFAALLYFREPEDVDQGGDLLFYKLAEGGAVKPRPAKIAAENVIALDRVRYAPNTLVTFINSPLCIHGVTPRGPTQHPRRYVNFLGECYGGRNRDGFFAAPDPWLNRMALRTQRHWRSVKHNLVG
jgi:hypothetical protein